MSTGDPACGNRRLVLKLGAVSITMFGFGFALSPLYSLYCKAAGINGTTGNTSSRAAAAGGVEPGRTITVEFTGNAIAGLPWEFRPLTRRIDVHPGDVTTVKYYVRNPAGETITGQAIPSVTPPPGATHFKKIECFCFSQQTLRPGESREMPVRFVVEPGVNPDVHTITLSYAFFNTDEASARRYGGSGRQEYADRAAHMHAMVSGS